MAETGVGLVAGGTAVMTIPLWLTNWFFDMSDIWYIIFRVSKQFITWFISACLEGLFIKFVVLAAHFMNKLAPDDVSFISCRKAENSLVQELVHCWEIHFLIFGLFSCFYSHSVI